VASSQTSLHSSSAVKTIFAESLRDGNMHRIARALFTAFYIIRVTVSGLILLHNLTSDVRRVILALSASRRQTNNHNKEN